MFFHKTPYTFLSYKKIALSVAGGLETFTFYHIYTSFHSAWGGKYFK